MRIDGFEVTFTSFPEGRTYTPPKGDVCALRGNEKAKIFAKRKSQLSKSFIIFQTIASYRIRLTPIKSTTKYA